jgi:hypothetical protein
MTPPLVTAPGGSHVSDEVTGCESVGAALSSARSSALLPKQAQYGRHTRHDGHQDGHQESAQIFVLCLAISSGAGVARSIAELRGSSKLRGLVTLALAE